MTSTTKIIIPILNNQYTAYSHYRYLTKYNRKLINKIKITKN